MSKVKNIIDALHHKELFGPHMEGDSWSGWEAFLAALFGLPLSPYQAKLYTRCTGRKSPPRAQFSEVWMIVGRRGGKSFVAALIALYLALFRDYRKFLKPGERGTVMIIAADRDQARVILNYIKGFLDAIPMLGEKVQSKRVHAVDFVNRITIEVRTANFRTVRGYTVVAALCDEIAFWRSEDAANPDAEIISALRPAMATIPNALLLGLSSPYRKAGVLYEAHRKHFGADNSDVLVWQAPTAVMNPSIDPAIIKKAYADDPAVASAEYGAEFRADISGLIDEEALEACLRGKHDILPPERGHQYKAFVDPSGGRGDAFTLAIGHREGSVRVIDGVWAREGKLVPASVAATYAAILREYRITKVTGDNYGGEWPKTAFAEYGIHYEKASAAKSQLYVQGLPLFSSALVSLPRDKKLVAEITRLERRTTKAGKDFVDHPKGGHDDRANAVFGLLDVLAVRKPEPRIRSVRYGTAGYDRSYAGNFGSFLRGN